jgi:hypothetical protein
VREFDKAYKAPLSDRARVRFGADIERGDVERFLVQLEYRMADGWTPIVRSDHNSAAVDGHDVESEGVHMNLYRDGEKYDVRQIGPPMSANAGLDRAEDHLVGDYQRHVKRFERWHNLNPNSNQ